MNLYRANAPPPPEPPRFYCKCGTEIRNRDAWLQAGGCGVCLEQKQGRERWKAAQRAERARERRHALLCIREALPGILVVLGIVGAIVGVVLLCAWDESRHADCARSHVEKHTCHGQTWHQTGKNSGFYTYYDYECDETICDERFHIARPVLRKADESRPLRVVAP